MNDRRDDDIRVGFALPHGDPGFASGAEASRSLAAAAEDAGFDYLSVADHVLGAEPGRPGQRSPYGIADPFREVFVHLGYLAALTGLELAPSVVVLPMRQTPLVAKQAAELSLLARGGLRLGVGIGWNATEYEAMGVDFAGRARRFEEQLRVLRLLWTEQVVRYEGEFHTLDTVGIAPLPPRGIPLWIGGGQATSARGTERVLRRIAALGDGWISGPALPAERLGPMMEQLRGYAREAGRDPDRIGLQATVKSGPDGDAGVLRQMDAVRAAGATHVTVDTRGHGLTAAGHAALLRKVVAGLR